MLDTLKEINVSVRQFSQGLSHYLGVPWTDAFYQHINRVLKGDVDATEDELRAFEMWHSVQKDPHVHGARLYRLSGLKESMSTLKRYMTTGIYNVTAVRKVFSRIMTDLG